MVPEFPYSTPYKFFLVAEVHWGAKEPPDVRGYAWLITTGIPVYLYLSQLLKSICRLSQNFHKIEMRFALRHDGTPMAGNDIEATSRRSATIGYFELTVRSAPHDWWQKAIDGEILSRDNAEAKAKSRSVLDNNHTASVVGNCVGVKLTDISNNEVGVTSLTAEDISLDAQTHRFKRFTRLFRLNAVRFLDTATKLISDVTNRLLVSLRTRSFSFIY